MSRRKYKVVGHGSHRRVIVSETREIDLGGVKNTAELEQELRNELMRIRSEVKSLKARAEEIHEMIRIIKNK